MLVIIVIEELVTEGCFINAVLNLPWDRMEVQKGNQLLKLHRKLNVHTCCCHLIAQTALQ